MIETTPGLTRHVDREVAAFFALAFAWSWAVWVPLIWLAPPDGIRTLLLVVGTFGPSAAASILLVTRYGAAEAAHRIAELFVWANPARLWILTLVAPAIVILAGVGLSTIVGAPAGGWQDPGRLYMVVPVFLYVLALGGPIGEELGWRGYALPLLQGERGPLRATAVLGVAWAAWHAPLFAIAGTVQRSIPPSAFAIQILATAVIYTWLWNRSRSLPLVIGFHAAFNTSVGLFPVLPETAGTSLPLWIALGLAVLIAAAIVVVTRGRLGLGATPRAAVGGHGDTTGVS